MDPVKSIRALLSGLSKHSLDERVGLFNQLQRALRDTLLPELPKDPALCPQLLRADTIQANDYNPNTVASVELDLLEESMRADGITMCVVVSADESLPVGYEVTDGFHRRHVAATRLKRELVPCAVLRGKSRAERMASTVRHNRARGKHQVELMGELVRQMMALGWGDERIAKALGMSEEELLRLKQTAGVARILAAPEYTRAWRGRDGHDGEDLPDEDGD